MSPTNTAQARSMYDAGQHTVQQIADTFGVSRPTIYRHLGTALPAPPKAAADTKQHGQPSRPKAVPARPRPPGARTGPAGSVVNSPGKRLVTVLVTLVVPDEADAEDAAGLVADAAMSTALEVVTAGGVEGHLPVPGSLVLRRAGGQPWRVEGVCQSKATLVDLAGDWVQTPLTRLVPDPSTLQLPTGRSARGAATEDKPGCADRARRRAASERRAHRLLH